MEEKIKRVLSRLQRQSDYEQQHKSEMSDEDRMLSITKETALFYNILLKSMRAKQILEVGLSTGYSTLWFADAIISNTKSLAQRHNSIITIEKSPAKVSIAKKNFEEAGVMDIIDIREGDAKEVFSNILKNFESDRRSRKGLFDFIFIDADKKNSIEYFELCLPMLRKNGIIAADNLLDTPEMKKYGEYVENKSKVESVLVPIGWGQELTRKT